MHRDINIYPTPSEVQLLERRASECGMSVDEFVAWLLRRALTETNSDINRIIKH